ncbi:MAG: cytochrome P460 family protein [Nitrospirota bacterium]|jgi:hypothetical protein|nr:cytochrome P460 family protein [Nitrospirota bacterium]MDH4360750.1 cytochrome P460 family protein [Nitrospirota bacterium]MDH5574835.1 cytochrome P460 family protein [Nitrospirota bacterium]
MKNLPVLFLVLALMVCSSVIMTPSAQSGSMPKDGELVFPTDYKSFPVFLSGVQKPDAVRDLYLNPIGAKTRHGQTFPNGSILVMEIYHAKKDAAGNFEKGADGLLVKADLAKVFVMQKDAGWGANAPDNLKNGDWIFSAFKPNGDRLEVDYHACRSCHLPLGDAKDYVHRYDEYFEKRGHAH